MKLKKGKCLRHKETNILWEMVAMLEGNYIFRMYNKEFRRLKKAHGCTTEKRLTSDEIRKKFDFEIGKKITCPHCGAQNKTDFGITIDSCLSCGRLFFIHGYKTSKAKSRK